MNLKMALLQIAEKALDETAEEFADLQKEQMDKSVYDWPRTTHRSNGETVSAPRDIVDTGQLKASQQYEKTGRFRHEYVYPEPYAAIVHEGGKTQSGDEYPSRPWIDDSAESVVDIFADKLRSHLN